MKIDHASGSSMNGAVSIIVPVYNCEKWLPDCIESLTRQTYSELEIILVNDGSTDGSLSICKKYEKQDERIYLVNKKNGGVSSARNTGLKHANGEWVTFVDADDWLETDAIERICRELQEDIDCCFCDIVHTPDKKGTWKPQYLTCATMEEIYCTIISGIEGKGFHFGPLLRAVWGKLYRTETIKSNNITFDEGLYIGEDAMFLLKYLSCLSGVERIKVTDICCYNYRLLNTSAVNRYKSDLLVQSVKQLDVIQEFFNEELLETHCMLKTSMTVFYWGIFNDLITNELKRNQMDINGLKWEDAKYWLRRNNKLMRIWNIKFWKMPRLIRFEWLCSRFLSEEKICLIKAYHQKVKDPVSKTNKERIIK